MNILNEFIKYIKIDTTSDSRKNDTPSTENQIEFAQILLNDLKKYNLDDLYFDEKHCYIYGLLKGQEGLPKLGFIAHMDTSEDAKGKDITPNIIENYDGKDILLKENIILSPNVYPDLKNHVGKTLITTGGDTLLGADDKAGIIEILYMLDYFSKNKTPHGDILVCFTPDEEIALGTLHLDLNYFNPDFAFTVDGSSVGEFSYENFNAAKANIKITGTPSHCGTAKGVMINAGRIATLINNTLPNEIPENTEGYEGFFYLEEISGNVGEANLEYLIRDFEKENFEKRKKTLTNIINKLNSEYKNCIELEITDTYYNMYDIIKKEKQLIDLTLKAIKKQNIEPKVIPIRGGTDGTKISYKGIPCPNLGTGGHNFHCIYEYICLEDMEQVGKILITIVETFVEHKN